MIFIGGVEPYIDFCDAIASDKKVLMKWQTQASKPNSEARSTPKEMQRYPRLTNNIETTKVPATIENGVNHAKYGFSLSGFFCVAGNNRPRQGNYLRIFIYLIIHLILLTYIE